MNGQDILKALNDIDTEMIEAAENAQGNPKGNQNSDPNSNYNSAKRRGWYSVAGMAVAAALVAVVGVRFYYSEGNIRSTNKQNPANNSQAENVIIANADSNALYEITHVEADNTYLFTAMESVVASSLEKDNTEFGSAPVVSEVEWSGAVHEDSWVNVLGKAAYSSWLQRALFDGREQVKAGKVTAEQLYYLVEIEISNADLSFVDNETKEAEYKRLTEEYGYDLTWVAPGGYVIPDAYTYCLGSGRMYGALTEEQLENFPAKGEYSYACVLTSQKSFNFTEYPYKETVTEAEKAKSLQIALDALGKATNNTIDGTSDSQGSK